jgi:hypothetical protein
MRNPTLIATVICIASSIAAAQTANMVSNGDFEQDVDRDGLADQWQFAGDEAVTATWARDQGYAGRFSQKLTCTGFASLSPASHAMLCQLDTVKLEKGTYYKISFAAKQQGIPGRAVHVAISNTRSWTNCGLQESFRASSEWKKFEFVFRAAQRISDNVRLQFWYTSTGSLWLDEVMLERSEPVTKRFLEVVAPAGSVNLLPNSSFECGTSGWGSIADIPGWGGNLNLPVGGADSATAKFHSSSFKIALRPDTIPVFYFDYFPLHRVPVRAPLLTNRGWIMVEKGAPYTLSAYMKADSKDLVGVLSINQAFQQTLQQQVRLRTNWARYSFTFEPRAGQVFVALGLDLKASQRDAGTVWIDGVQLEKGSGATAYRPRAPIEVGLETNRVGNVFSYGLEPEITATVFSAERVSRHVVLDVQTTDFDDTVVNKAAITVEISGGQKLTVPIGSGVQRKGFYRLRLSCEGATIASTQPMRFAIIEPYTEPDSLFGMNHAYPWSHLLDLSRQIGICWFRDWSLKWHDVEPEKGRFEFTEPDHQINRVLERGLNVIGLLPFPSANWSSSAGPQVQATRHYPENRERVAYMPADLNDLAAYVGRTVQHYKGRLNVWEILNEPIYTYEFIGAGGLRWVDALNLHAYPGLMSPEAYEQPLRRLREKMRSVGEDKPIWFTEGAYYADDDKPFEPYDSTWLKPIDSEAEAAEWQVKFNTLLLAYGAEKIIYHSGTPGSVNNESLSGIFFEWAGAPRKMLTAQAAMANLLTPPLRSFGYVGGPDDIKSYGFETRGRTVVVAWLKEGFKPRKISLIGKQWAATDLQGNELEVDTVTLTGRPVYFVARGSSGKKPPW